MPRVQKNLRGYMSDLLLPDYIFKSYKEITPEFLKKLGIKALLIDIDNTLAPYEQDLPDEDNLNWVKALKQSGIKATIISNNKKERVELFGQAIGLHAIYKSKKPFSKNLRIAMRQMESDETNTAVIGDQLLTDAAAGKHIGLITLIVPPINDKRNLFFKTKRAMEVKHIKKYVKLHGEDEKKICSFWLEKQYKNR